jgi:hypothetical protein
MALLTLGPTFFNLCLVGIGGIVFWYISSAAISWYRLRKFPGPVLASFSYLWLGNVANSARQCYVYRDLCKKYGPLVRVGPNVLTTDDPETIRKISAARSPYGRGAWNTAGRFNPYHDNIFTILDVVAHDKLKSKIGGAFSGAEAPLLESSVNEQVTKLIQVIRKKYAVDPTDKHGGTLLDFAPLTSYFTMDIITKVVFGQEFGYLAADADLYAFLHTVREGWPILAVSIEVPLIRAILFSPWFLKLFGPKVTDKLGMGKLMRCMRRHLY